MVGKRLGNIGKVKVLLLVSQITAASTILSLHNDLQSYLTPILNYPIANQYHAAQANTASFSGRYLVVCNHIENALELIFSNFTIIHLNKNETPPPWSAEVFLHGEKCVNHPYVVEAIQRRNQSPTLAASNPWPASGWMHGVRWPNVSIGSTSYLRVIRDRPAIIKVLGEVFWRSHYVRSSCSDTDFLFYREVDTPFPDCLTVHFLQGVTTTLLRGVSGEFGLHNTTNILERRVAHPNKPSRDKIHYDHFCSFIVKYDSSAPMLMFRSPMYDIDAIVRHIFFLQLSTYKSCERITNCSGGPYTNFNCMFGYKFHVTMENTMIDGYVSEKLFNGALGGGIPIYFGAPDVGNYVNDKSFICCNVSKEVIEEMRSFYPRGPHPRLFLFTNSSGKVTDEELLSWADEFLHPYLQKCIQRVVELDKNDQKYISMLNEPFILNHDIMSGWYPLQGILQAYYVLKNPPDNPNLNSRGIDWSKT